MLDNENNLCPLIGMGDWWPASESTAIGIWWKICSLTRDKLLLEVGKVIGVAFFWTVWTLRNSKVFRGEYKKEKEIFVDIQYLAFNWIRSRAKYGKSLNWDRWVCNPADVVSYCTNLDPR